MRGAGVGLQGAFDLSELPVTTYPLDDELELGRQQPIRLGFVADFGFLMEPGVGRRP
jgi:hypothetical protein